MEDDDNLDIDGSADFINAENAVKLDRWDVTSWITFLEEVEEGKGRKGLSIDDAYKSFLESYPRAAPFWKTLTEYHIRKKDYDAAQAVFSQCLEKCRSVVLWHSYLSMMKTLTVDTVSKYSDNFTEERKKLENSFESAVKNVGTSVDSSSIWGAYIDFVKDWPEVGAVDSGRKLTALRSIYQRCVCTPLDDIDTFWSAYEQLELRAGEHHAEKVLPEFSPRKDHAKAVLKDRKQLITGKISLDRLAIPPTQSLVDLKQLDNWKKLLIFELTNPENLDDEGHQSHMIMIFDQSLCVLQHFAEIWLSYSDYLSKIKGADSAKTLLQEAVVILPQVASISIAIAELDEREGQIDAARTILNQLFTSQPSAFSFSVLQRFIRRVDGIDAARKLFESTHTARMNASKAAVLGYYAIYMAHAELEINCNNEALVALRVLELATKRFPFANKDVGFVRLMALVLVRLQMAVALRSLYETVLGGEEALTEAAASSRRKETVSSDDKERASLTLVQRLELCDEYLKHEIVMNQSSILRLDQLREQRNATALLVEEQRKVLTSGASTSSSSGSDTFSKEMLVVTPLDTAALLLERHYSGTSSLPILDHEMRERNRRDRSLLEEKSESERKRLASLTDAGRSGIGEEADIAALAAVPSFLRDLLPRLPKYEGPQLDIGAFIELLKKTVLPPRPHVDIVVNTGGSSTNTVSKTKRGRDDNSGADNDVFRKRQRARLAGAQ